jgi:hypothetical protein
MSQSILVIRGENADLIRIRRSINVEGITTTNLIYHEGELNRYVPKLPDGYKRFNALIDKAFGR